MVEARPEENITAPQFGHGKVDDGIKREIQSVACGARGLRQLLCGVPEWQICIKEVRAQSQILVRVARHAGRAHNASASYPGFRRAAVQIGSGADVEGPVL